MPPAVVIPTYNEHDNLEVLVTRVLDTLPGGRLLIVDDSSPDGTGDLAERLAARHAGRMGVLHRARKEGLGAAYVAGFTDVLQRWPDVDFIFQMDADLSHDPVYLQPMLEAAQDVDLVVGSRYTQGVSIVNWPLHRLIISKLGTAYARAVTGLPITDCTGGYKCWRADVLRAINLGGIRSNGYCFQIETSFRAWRLGYRLRDYPIIFYERRKGQSKLNMSIAFEAFVVVARLGLERLRESASGRRREQPL